MLLSSLTEVTETSSTKVSRLRQTDEEKRRQAECVSVLGIGLNEFALHVMFTSGSTCKQPFL